MGKGVALTSFWLRWGRCLSCWAWGKSSRFEILEDITIGWRFQFRAPFDRPADPRLVLLGVDDASLEFFRRVGVAASRRLRAS